MENYRLISLLEVPGKVLERIIQVEVQQHLEDENILSREQNGSRRGRGTETAIALAHEAITKNLNTGRFVSIVLRDVKATFDKVWHQGLLWKLDNLIHIPLLGLKTIASYLHDRSIRFKYSGHLSDPFTPQASVPQGSTLAPTLYITYTHDMPRPNHHSTYLFTFADDVSVLTTGRNPHLPRNIQAFLDRLAEYEDTWRIKTNPQKTSLTYFGAPDSNLHNYNIHIKTYGDGRGGVLGLSEYHV